jgi:hypothetical protein
MPDYIHPVLTREAWQKLRKNPPKWDVPKGAAKVSIGDAITAVHKPLSLATIDQNIKDTEKLIASLTTYIDTIKKNSKYAPFATEVEKVKKRAGHHLQSMKNIASKKSTYQKDYNNASYILVQLIRKNPGTAPKDLAAKLNAVTPSVQAFALIEDRFKEVSNEAVGWVNKCTAAKILSSDDIEKLSKFFQKIAPKT